MINGWCRGKMLMFVPILMRLVLAAIAAQRMNGIGWVLGVEVVLGGPYLVETQVLCQLGELQYLLIVLCVGSAELGRVLCEKEQSKLHT